MLLSLTTDKISLITAEACDVDVVAIFTDRNSSTGAVGASDKQLTHPTTATTTDIVASPGATTTRAVREITVRNAHASTSVDVLVQLNANGTLYELHSARLYPTEMLAWTLESGFKKISVRNEPFFGRKSNYPNVSQATTVVTSSQLNAIQAWGTGMIVPPSKEGGLTRKLAAWSMCHYLTAITTTGIALGVLGENSGGTAQVQSSIAAVTGSVTASTQATTASTGWDKLTAHGTAAVTNLLALLASGLVFTENASPDQRSRDFTLAMSTEVAGSQATLSAGAFFELFENTD